MQFHYILRQVKIYGLVPVPADTVKLYIVQHFANGNLVYIVTSFRKCRNYLQCDFLQLNTSQIDNFADILVCKWKSL